MTNEGPRHFPQMGVRHERAELRYVSEPAEVERLDLWSIGSDLYLRRSLSGRVVEESSYVGSVFTNVNLVDQHVIRRTGEPRGRVVARITDPIHGPLRLARSGRLRKRESGADTELYVGESPVPVEIVVADGTRVVRTSVDGATADWSYSRDLEGPPRLSAPLSVRLT
jgi:hypothetical protein